MFHNARPTPNCNISLLLFDYARYYVLNHILTSRLEIFIKPWCLSNVSRRHRTTQEKNILLGEPNKMAVETGPVHINVNIDRLCSITLALEKPMCRAANI